MGFARGKETDDIEKGKASADLAASAAADVSEEATGDEGTAGGD